jgi:hypothetical protein
MTDTLEVLISRLPGPVALIAHGIDTDSLIERFPQVELRTAWQNTKPSRATRSVLLAVRDRTHLRSAAAVLGDHGQCSTVACWVSASAGRGISLVPRPEWPPIARMSSCCSGSATLDATFAKPVNVQEVLEEIARFSIVDTRPRPGRHVVGINAEGPWPPDDPRTQVIGAIHDEAIEPLPVDVVVQTRDDSDYMSPKSSPIAATPAPVVTVEPMLSWSECAMRPSWWQRSTARDIGPLDEKVLNPGGYLRGWQAQDAQLMPIPGAPHLLRITNGSRAHTVDTRFGLSDADVARLRAFRSIHVTWRGGHGPHAYARVVASLAMAGIPLTAGDVPQWAKRLLDPHLLVALREEADLTSEVSREAHSIRARRAALQAHSAAVWRGRILGQAGRMDRNRLSVSVLLATNRPEQVAFAIRQVDSQVGVDVELVLVTHGFELADDQKSAISRKRRIPTVFVPAPPSMVFGDVLNLGAAHASGDLVLKMDDDDWYGSQFVSDLILARHYSGAQLVGCPAEFVFVDPLWVTIRRPDRSELYGSYVAGGTMLIGRDELRTLGGFRPFRRAVDAGLLSSVRRSGGTAYRSHGFNYLLRRRGSGHTWDPGVAYFVSRSRVTNQWRGFRPPAGVSPEPQDRPERIVEQPRT